jgi:hypothetical protein
MDLFDGRVAVFGRDVVFGREVVFGLDVVFGRDVGLLTFLLAPLLAPPPWRIRGASSWSGDNINKTVNKIPIVNFMCFEIIMYR